MMETCPACGHPGSHDGPVHAYMSPSPACWARYGEVLTREYSDANYWRAHRLLTDAYCGQHSIGADRRARQSLWIHIAALILHFEDGCDGETIVSFLRRAAKSGHGFPALAMPPKSLSLRIDSIYTATSPQEHAAAVETYAEGVYTAWSPHHDDFRSLITEVGT